MSLSLIQLASTRLGYLGERQQLLAQNIANLDTPGYSPKTTASFQTILDGAGTLPLAQTSSEDIPAPADASAFAQDQVVDSRAPDGNAVSLDQQLAAISNNDLSQQFAVNVYQSYMGMFKTALGSTQ